MSLWNIAGMVAYKFQIIQNFLHVCQSISWLNSVLKLNKYRDISSSGWDKFLISDFLKTFLGCCYTSSKLFKISCVSASLLVGLLPFWKGQVLAISMTKGGCRTHHLPQRDTSILLHLPSWRDLQPLRISKLQLQVLNSWDAGKNHQSIWAKKQWLE